MKFYFIVTFLYVSLHNIIKINNNRGTNHSIFWLYPINIIHNIKRGEYRADLLKMHKRDNPLFWEISINFIKKIELKKAEDNMQLIFINSIKSGLIK